MRTRATRTKDGSVGISEWNLNSMTEFREVVKKAIDEAMEVATTEYHVEAWLEAVLGYYDKEAPPEDISTIAMRIPLGAHEDDGPVWVTTISALVEMAIQMHVAGRSGKFHNDDLVRERFKKLRDSLAASIAQIDYALGDGTSSGG